MATETRRKKCDGAGFTLLEILLTVALLLGLLGAVVYNFESAKRGTDLQEGARQFEALIRFAGAQAANSGKTVQFRFGNDVAFSSNTDTNSVSEISTNSVNDFPAIEDLEDWGAKLHVVYEPDPVLQPGVFVDLPEARPFLEALNDRVRIEKVQMPERPLNQSTNELAMADVAARPEVNSVTFYPDGSSETADIFLVSREREDLREMVLHLDGVTRKVRTELHSGDDLVPIEWMEDENSSQQQKQSSTETGSAKEPAPVTETSASNDATTMPEDPAFENSAKNDTTKTNIFEDLP